MYVPDALQCRAGIYCWLHWKLSLMIINNKSDPVVPSLLPGVKTRLKMTNCSALDQHCTRSMSQRGPRPLLPAVQTFSPGRPPKRQRWDGTGEQTQSGSCLVWSWSWTRTDWPVGLLFFYFYLSIKDKYLLLPLDMNHSATEQTEARK